MHYSEQLHSGTSDTVGTKGKFDFSVGGCLLLRQDFEVSQSTPGLWNSLVEILPLSNLLRRPKWVACGHIFKSPKAISNCDSKGPR